jgi:hypothetical protein
MNFGLAPPGTKHHEEHEDFEIVFTFVLRGCYP